MCHRTRVDNSSIVVQLLYLTYCFHNVCRYNAFLDAKIAEQGSDGNSSYNDKGKAHGTEI